MNYSFEYIDIILLAMIAGFIFLRLRGILGKRTHLVSPGMAAAAAISGSLDDVRKYQN